MNPNPPPQAPPPQAPPPQARPPAKKPLPSWAIVLIVLGAVLGVGVAGLVVVLGLVAFACSRH